MEAEAQDPTDAKAVTPAGMPETTGELPIMIRALDRLDEIGIARRKVVWEPPGYGGRLDALVRLAHARETVEYGVVGARKPMPATVGALANQLAAYPGRRLLLADYVTPPMGERLRELGIAFVDTLGNAWIHDDQRLIHITGRRPEARPREHRTARLFKPGGLKTAFALLCRPDLVATPLRDLAHAAGVAHGTAAWAMQDLKAAGYVREQGKRGRVFVQRRKLLDLWAEAWPRLLKPKLEPRRFNVPDPWWWKRFDFAATGALLGGEGAGAVLTDLLKPETVTIYTTRGLAPVAMAQIMLPPDQYANTEVLPAFWNFVYPWNHTTIVPPVLVYADLLATGDDRCIETARRIFDDYLADLVRDP